jgi:hypothetical protein
MPNETHVAQFLDQVATRWWLVARLRLFTRAALGVGLLWLAGITLWWLVGRTSLGLESLVVGVVGLATAGLIVAIRWFLPTPPSRADVARLIEERVHGLDDRLATSADVLARAGPELTGPVARALFDDTTRALGTVSAADIIAPELVRRGWWQATGAVALLLAAGAVLFEPASRATRAAWLFASPGSLAFRVEPGNVRVRPATPLTIRVAASASVGSLVPDLEARIGEAARREHMVPEGDSRFAVTFKSVPASFTYHVQLAGRRSSEYQVTLLEPPRVARIDLSYEFPAFTRLPARDETDAGDIYAPEGTRVHLVVTPRHTTAPIASASLTLRTGKELPLSRAADGSYTGDLVVSADDGYRVRLTDTDGLQNVEDPEYFVRMLDDRPPEVRIVRPAGDRQVTPLEEVEVEARADDDHGVQGLELVYGVKGGSERVVPLGGDGATLSVTGRHTIPLEELQVSPGDFVTFYARARDIGRGKKSTESRSDIFFLEVTPFVDEFALAQSQAMAAGGQSSDDLVRLQKEIIIGTWKLDRRSSGIQPSAEDVRTLARAQATLRQRTEALAMRVAAGTSSLHAPDGHVDAAADSPLAGAARAMTRAEQALLVQKTAAALPAEMEALNFLLKAQSDAQRKEITRQAGTGGGSRAQQDLSTLFDRELQRQQQTNYETPKTAEEKREDSQDKTLERVRELARRQEALQRQQDDLARDRKKLDEEEVRRRLERLTREQSDLRREAELLAQQMQQNERRQREGEKAQSAQTGEQAKGATGAQRAEGAKGAKGGEEAKGAEGGKGGEGSQSAELRQASEDMRGAASQLRREDPDAARSQSARALERLKGVERSLRESGPDERRRAVGDAQLEARQLAARQRQVSEQAGRAVARSDQDASRRLAGEQEQLAQRAETLGQRLDQLGREGTDKSERDRLAGAAREARGTEVAGKMRDMARGLQDDPKSAKPEQGRDVARSLDRLADQVAGTIGGRDREGQQLSDGLSRTRELRERLAELERQIGEQVGRQKATGDPSAQKGTSEGDGSPGDPSAQASQSRRLAELQRQYTDELKKAADSDERVREAVVAGTGGAGSTPVGQTMVTSAPGTEAFKQDFARWESLHRELTLGLERLEASLSQRVIEKAARERLPSGSADATPSEYADSVDRYFRALAQEPR